MPQDESDHPAKAAARLMAVDRLEGRLAILVDDSNEVHEVPSAELPKPVREGACFSIPIGTGGKPLWRNAVPAPEEERRRKAEAKERIARLSANDHGGDLDL